MPDNANDHAHFEELAKLGGFAEFPGNEIAAMSVGFLLSSAAKRLERDLESNYARPYGLTWAGFRTMTALHFRGAMTHRKLADALFIAAGSLTTVVRNLEKAGLIVRDNSAGVGHAVPIELTARGKSVVEEFFEWNRERQQQWMAEFTPEEQVILARTLTKLIDLEVAFPTRPTKSLESVPFD